MCCRIYDVEKKTKTVEKFRFPNFETINWFAAEKLYEQIKELNMEEKKCPATLLTGLKTLLSALKQWNMEKDVGTCCFIYVSLKMLIVYVLV